MPLEQLQWDHIQGAELAGLQSYRWGHAVVVGLQPAGSTDTPVITGLQPRESVLRCRCRQVVPLGAGVREKALIHHTADRVTAQIGAVAAATAVAVPTSHRLTAADGQWFTEDIARPCSGTACGVDGLGHSVVGMESAGSLAKVWNKKRPGG